MYIYKINRSKFAMTIIACHLPLILAQRTSVLNCDHNLIATGVLIDIKIFIAFMQVIILYSYA